MTWHLSGRTWQLLQAGEVVDALVYDDAQRVYVDLRGAPLSPNFDNARRVCEVRAEKRRKA